MATHIEHNVFDNSQNNTGAVDIKNYQLTEKKVGFSVEDRDKLIAALFYYGAPAAFVTAAAGGLLIKYLR